jgi:hypothetical protein
MANPDRDAIKARHAWQTLRGFPRPFPFAWSDPPPGWDQAVDLLTVLVLTTKNGWILAREARCHDTAERYTAFTLLGKDAMRDQGNGRTVIDTVIDVRTPIGDRDRKHIQHMAMAYFAQQAQKEGIPPKRAKHLVATVFGRSDFTVRNALREFPR